MVLGMRRAVAKLQRHQWGIWELRTLLLDLRFGGLVGGQQESRFRHLGSNDVQSIPYRVIRDAMRGLAVTPEDVLVDVGCGLGRVINWWLNLGLANRMIGIELDPDVAQRTRTRLAPFRNVSIITGDAADCTPDEATICLLFNPFGSNVMQQWHASVVNRKWPNGLTVLYVNCQHLEVFQQSNWWDVNVLPKNPVDYSEIAILKLRT